MIVNSSDFFFASHQCECTLCAAGRADLHVTVVWPGTLSSSDITWHHKKSDAQNEMSNSSNDSDIDSDRNEPSHERFIQVQCAFSIFTIEQKATNEKDNDRSMDTIYFFIV